MDYPMLANIDTARVDYVGGKIGILEAILAERPETNIPEFSVLGQEKPGIKRGGQLRILRSSSPLDVFGGFGLYPTYRNAHGSDWSSLYELEKDGFEHKVRLFTQSLGLPLQKPTWMLQDQGTPDYYVVTLQHPTDHTSYIVNYSTRPSIEIQRDGPYSFKRSSDLARQTYTVTYNVATGSMESPHFLVESDLVEKAVSEHIALQELGIIHSGWVSLMEAGFYSDTDKLEIYQFTPLRRKSTHSRVASGAELVLGQSEQVTLPVVQMPSCYVVKTYFNNPLRELSLYPDFEDYAKPVKEAGELYLEAIPMPQPLLFQVFSAYMESIEERFSQGYILLTQLEGNHLFDISMKNARAVIANADRGLGTYLNHDISRLLYKAPNFIVSDQQFFMPTGSLATFSSLNGDFSFIQAKS